ncbi:protein kinase domain-containing protein [Zavarzinella formosa]|uniref:protein kinase domain-containing protein n=1 Tax=Zavarzinella formosa TaxID=360055 RepID=UPI0002E0CD3A|nr:protein kinase [Zavarzinella formosa]
MPHPLASELEGLKLFVKGKLPPEGIRLLTARLTEPGILDDVIVAIGRQAGTLATALRKRPRDKNPAEDALADMLLGKLGDAGSTDGDDTEAGSAGSRSKLAKLPQLTSFEIRKVLGQGGMGTVYLAEDPRLGRQVAIKTLKREFAEKPGAVARFLLEAKTAAKIEHDHICPIYQTGEEGGIPFIAMPFLKGEPLDVRMKREKRLPIADAIRIGREIALGLAAAHEAGLIHRDIKPANVWLESGRGQFPRVRILDFGLARGLGQDNELTAAGTVVGTPSYMAPEQARGKKVDGRADLWSLGVILYEMTVGAKPFTGEDTIAILASLALDNPTPPHEANPGVPQPLSDLIMRLLAKNADARPANGHVVADELAQIQGSATLPSIPVPAATGPDPWGGLSGSTEVVDSSSSASTSTKQTKALKQPGKPRSLLLPLAIGGGAVFTLIAAIAIFLLSSGGKDGTLMVEADGEAESRFKNGKLELYDDGRLKYTLEPGERVKPVASGNYQVRMVGGDGVKLETDSVTMKGGGKATIRLSAERPAVATRKDPPKTPPAEPVPPKTTSTPKTPADPNPPKLTPEAIERRAAEYVLSVGGRIRTNYDMPEVTTAAKLPGGSFHMGRINLSDSKVTDDGLALLKNCRGLFGLYLANTAVTDVGTAHFKGRRDLLLLSLANTAVTDEGLAGFQDCANLRELDVSGTSVTDAGVVRLQAHPNLAALWLNGVRIGDGAAAMIPTLSKLTILDVRKTNLKSPAITKLAERLPQCQIFHDGGVIEPSSPADPDRLAAEHVLSNGGFVRLDDEPHSYRGKGSLPKRPFILTGCEFESLSAHRVTDAMLGIFRHCKNLTEIGLSNSSITDAGLELLRGCPRLASISLSNTAVTDAGLARLKDCKDVERLMITNTAITDAGLTHIKDWKHLASFNIAGTKISDDSLPVLQGLSSLIHIYGAGCAITPAGVARLEAKLPDCTVEIDRQPFGELAGSDPDRGAALYTLSFGGAVQVNGEPRWIKSATELPPPPFRLTGSSAAGMPIFPLEALMRYYRGCQHLRVLDVSGNQYAEPWLGMLRKNKASKLRDLDLQGSFAGESCLPTIEGFAELATLNVRGTRLTPEQIARLAAKLPNCKIEHDGDNVPAAEAESDRRAADYVVQVGGAVRINLSDRRIKSVADLSPKPFRLTDIDLSDNMQLSSARLAAFRDCKNLRRVRLAGTPATDDTAALFKASKGLEFLDLAGTKTGDTGLANFKGFDRMRHLDVSGTTVGDGSLTTIASLTSLESLNVTKARLSVAGVKQLATKLPQCRITHDGGVTGPK